MNEFDNEARLAIYRFFVAEGRAPVAAELSERLGAQAADVEDAFRRLHDEHVLVLAPGTPYIWMANPLSALPTPYRATVDGKTYFANCIWDAFGVIAMVGPSGMVTARCPDCATELTAEVRNGELVTDDYVVHYAVPAARWWDDIGFG